MSELEEFKKVVSPIAYGLAYKSELGTTEYQQLYAEEDVIKYFNNKPQLTIPKSIADLLDEIPNEAKEYVRVNDFGEYSVLDDFVELREFYEADEDEIFPKFMKLKDFVKDNLNLCVIYLAGKALGVDLVKVGADEN